MSTYIGYYIPEPWLAGQQSGKPLSRGTSGIFFSIVRHVLCYQSVMRLSMPSHRLESYPVDARQLRVFSKQACGAPAMFWSRNRLPCFLLHLL
jgi:hypothetical protein